MEVCPNCGSWAELNEYTGWCSTCTVEHHPPDYEFCPECGHPMPKTAKRCWSCKDARFLERYADKLEWYLHLGFSLKVARRLCIRETQPKCLSCGEPIKGGKSNHLFCKNKATCRKWSRKYRTLRERIAVYNKDLAAEAALEIIKREVAAYNESANNSTGEVYSDELAA